MASDLAVESLKPNRSLLDPKFEGYKLSIEPLIVNSAQLVTSVHEIPLREDVFSLQHVRAFANHNHLVADLWSEKENGESVYFVDEDFQVQQASIKDQDVDEIKIVFMIPEVDKKKDNLNVCLSFPSAWFACVSDGSGKLHILNTGDRTKSGLWKLAHTFQLDRPFTILHTTQSEDTGSIGCLLLSIVDDKDAETVRDSHLVYLDLVLFSQSVTSSGASEFTNEKTMEFLGHTTPVYAAIEPGINGVLVASERSFHLVKDEAVASPIEETSSNDNNNERITVDEDEESSADAAYTWSQGHSDVTVAFELPEGTSKNDIACVIKVDHITVVISNNNTLLEGPLFAKIDTDGSTWTLEETRLEVTLQKHVADHHWSTVVTGDKRGRYELLGEEAKRVQEIHERLEHLTSDKLNPDPNPQKQPFNQQQLEECDFSPEDVEYIFRLDAASAAVTHKTCLAGHQWVFNTLLVPNKPPIFCLRHDVDALLWQPRSQPNHDSEWKHVGTFNALGYVQASKQNRKFSTCSPNMEYAAICDNTRHAYVYHQPKDGAKNAVQQVITLDSQNRSIIGFQTTNRRMYILTPESLSVVTVI